MNSKGGCEICSLNISRHDICHFSCLYCACGYGTAGNFFATYVGMSVTNEKSHEFLLKQPFVCPKCGQESTTGDVACGSYESELAVAFFAKAIGTQREMVEVEKREKGNDNQVRWPTNK